MYSSSSTSTSLIITTYNAPSYLGLVLDSVRDLSPLPKEVIIADDGSTDDTATLIARYKAHFPCPLLHIWQEDKGFRAASIRNKAIRASMYDYIILIDGDMVLDPHFIADHVRFARRGVLLQGSRTGLSHSATQILLEHYRANHAKAYQGAFAYKRAKSYRCSLLAYLANLPSTTKKHLQKTPFIKPVIRTCNMSFFRADFDKVGGFHEGFIGWGREDSAFIARALLLDMCVKRTTFGAVGYHLHHVSNPPNPNNDRLYFDLLASYGICY